jgi:hypothetical protein
MLAILAMDFRALTMTNVLTALAMPMLHVQIRSAATTVLATMASPAMDFRALTMTNVLTALAMPMLHVQIRLAATPARAAQDILAMENSVRMLMAVWTTLVQAMALKALVLIHPLPMMDTLARVL